MIVPKPKLPDDFRMTVDTRCAKSQFVGRDLRVFTHP